MHFASCALFIYFVDLVDLVEVNYILENIIDLITTPINE